MYYFHLILDALMDDVVAVLFLQSWLFGHDNGFCTQLFSRLVNAKPSMFIVLFLFFLNKNIKVAQIYIINKNGFICRKLLLFSVDNTEVVCYFLFLLGKSSNN